MDVPHEVIRDRIGRGVDQLVEDRFAIDELDDAGLLAGPEVLPVARSAFWLRARSL